MSKFAFVFPGQGSQSVGMLADVAAVHPVIQETFAEASAALGRDLWALAQQGPAEEQNQTENTQPLLLAAGVAVYRAWRAAGGAVPAVMAGHSLGEYTALVAAGVISLVDGVRLVAGRARLMQSAVPAGEGAMAAILGLDDAVVREICQKAAASSSAVVEAVNFNAPGQVVIAGTAAAVQVAIEQLKSAGAKRALPLPVSVPSHCALMKPAAQQLESVLASITFNRSDIPVVQNVAARVEADAEAIRAALIAQLYQPVLWVDCVQQLSSYGVSRVIEAGPGKVLTGLNKRIVPDSECLSVDGLEAFAAALAAV